MFTAIDYDGHDGKTESDDKGHQSSRYDSKGSIGSLCYKV